MALRPLAMPQTGGESYLALLLRRRGELERLVVGFSDEVDRLKAGDCSATLRRRLHRARRAEVRASQALERLEWVIADTPAETLDDVVLKLRFCAELQGDGGEPAGWRAPFTVEEQLLRTIIADLKHLKARTE